MKILKLALMAVIFSSLFVKCDCSSEKEDDDEEPVIEVISPNNNTVFYTTESQATPTSIVANAKATDDNEVAGGLITVTNANGEVKHTKVETGYEVYTSFSTTESGIYTIEFEFTDLNGNVATESRTVICEVLSGGDDVTSKN